jgi:alkaline phosphatase D
MLAGSCAYFNEPIYDRPGRPYGNDSSIFKSMAKENADLMLWLGDNWYTREVDYYSEWGLNYRAQRDRSQQVLQPLLKAMPNYAVWDDHDYGYNNAGLSYPLKETSRSVFTSYWANPSYGEASEGIYSRFIWNDVEFFVLDDRYFRSDDKLPDSINGQPNPSKKMFGDKQLNWLENALSQSSENYKINFRFIVSGSQILNELNPYDCLTHYPIEYNELINFITKNKIEGVVFLTGDRHHSEIIKKERNGTYPLLDITASPLTSGLSKFTGKEKNHPSRIIGIDHTTNYGKISFTGTFKERKMKIEFIGPGGESLTVYEIDAKDLK